MSTPEQLPEVPLVIVVAIGDCCPCIEGDCSNCNRAFDAILAALTAARAEATEKERERCARVADAYRKELARIPACCECSLGPNACEDIAEEIRQGEPQGSQEPAK